MRNLICVILVVVVSTSCGKQIEISNGDLFVKIDDKMQMLVISLNEQTSSFFLNQMPTDKLIAKEFAAEEFQIVSYSKSEESGGLVHHLSGDYRKEGFHIRKEMKIRVPEGFADMLLFDIRYVNLGEKVATVTGWINHQMKMDRTDEQTPIWSLQASSDNRRVDWILPVTPGFYQKNYLGMNNSDYGGGIPVVDLWRRDGGFAVGLVEETLKMVSLPVEMGLYDNFATACISYEYEEPVILKQNDTVQTFQSFIYVHTGDFFNSLRQFSLYMQSKGLHFAEPEEEAFEAVWCAWGYERSFTINEVLGTLPKVKELGFKWVDIDDGYQITEGDWETNRRFAGGDRDMRRLADAIHSLGLKAKLWWAPLAVDPCADILKKFPGLLLTTVEGTPQFITWWDSYYISPVNPQTKEYTRDLVKRFLQTWDFDGLKMDGQHLNCCLPDHNPASGLDYPDQAFERLPEFFKDVFETARQYKPHAVIQNCPCGTAMNFFNMPYMNQAVSSDPLSSWQIRLKGKVYRAIFDKIAYYADHVELSDGGNDFPTQIGIGAVVGSKFTYPKDNPDVKTSYLLTPEKETLYKKWLAIYNEKMLSKGDYLNLYNLTFDKPEAHVIRKDGKMYYAFYADEWNGEEIELRGLDNKVYTIREYTGEEANAYTLEGSRPIIQPYFKGSYLIEVY